MGFGGGIQQVFGLRNGRATLADQLLIILILSRKSEQTRELRIFSDNRQILLIGKDKILAGLGKVSQNSAARIAIAS